MSQAQLFPVSETEFTEAAYALAMLLQQLEEEDFAWDEAKKAHKETVAVLRRGVSDQRQIIRRAQLERHEGLTQRQVDALLDQAKEQEE